MNDEMLFSQRNGINQCNEPEITIRNDAPPALRSILVQIAYDCKIDTKRLRRLVCNLLMQPIDENNWSDSNIIIEIKYLIDNAEWYEVYDIIEEICLTFHTKEFVTKMNKYFIKNGIGWQIIDNEVQVRNPEALDAIINNSLNLLSRNDGALTTYKELKLAIEDLSRRPHVDITGAIQHAMAALECYARSCICAFMYKLESYIR